MYLIFLVSVRLLKKRSVAIVVDGFPICSCDWKMNTGNLVLVRNHWS